MLCVCCRLLQVAVSEVLSSEGLHLGGPSLPQDFTSDPGGSRV